MGPSGSASAVRLLTRTDIRIRSWCRSAEAHTGPAGPALDPLDANERQEGH